MPDKKGISYFDSIRFRLIAAFILIVVLPMSVVIAVRAISVSEGAHTQLSTQLDIVAGLKESAINTRVATLEAELGNGLIGENTLEYIEVLVRNKSKSETPEDFQKAHDILKGRFLQLIAQLHRFDTIFLMDLKGRVVLSTEHTLEGRIFAGKDFFLQGLKETTVLPAFMNKIVVTRPVKNKKGILAVLAGISGMETFNEIIHVPAGLGSTGKAYLVCADFSLLTPLQGINPGIQVHSHGIRAVLENRMKGSAHYTDFRGVPVNGAYRWLPELGAALMVEQDKAESARTGNVMLAVNASVMLAAIIIAAFASLVVTRSIATPLSELADTASRIAGGRLDLSVEVKRKDEIGALAEAFNFMTAKLRETMDGLKESQEHYRRLFDDSPISLWEEDFSQVMECIEDIGASGITDFRTYFDRSTEMLEHCLGLIKVLDVNKATLNLFRVENKNELKDLRNFMTKESYGVFREELLTLIGGGLQFEGEAVLHTASGDRVYTLMHLSVVPGFEHSLEKVLVSFLDITTRKKMEEEIVRSQKLESVGVLAGGIAHDFNNLLTAILGNISLAKILMSPGDKAYERLNDAETASLRAKDLTQRLLTFSTGGAPVRETISAGEVVRDSVRLACSGSAVKCEIIIPDELCLVEADEGQLHQAFNNIVINAVQAMPKGGKISVKCDNVFLGSGEVPPLERGEYVRIGITDEGIGIPEEHIGRIFDPYFTTREKGKGLGLATAYSIVKNHDGHITVKSEIGRGTTFSIYLPASKTARPARKPEEMKVMRGKGKILVMDDEDVVRQVAAEMLRLIGYEVEVSGDGNETLEAYRNALESGKPFHAVIMDLTVPGGMGGKEAVRKLLEIDPQAKAIVSSGYSNDPVMANFRDYGFAAVVSKPYRVAELAEQLRKVLQGGNL